ncbi:MAG: hypothetical protein ACMUIU_05535 [bacterium]
MDRIAKGCILGILCIILTFSLSTAYGQGFFNFEASTEFLNRESDYYEMRDYGLIATSYFKKVDLGSHPWAEAAFMEHASSISVPAGIIQVENSDSEDGDGSVFGVDVTYIHPVQPIYANVSFFKTGVEFDTSNDEISMNQYNLGIGMFVRNDLLVAFKYGYEKEEFKDQVLGVYKVKNNLYSVATKWVNEKANGTALNLEGSIGLDNYDNGVNDGSNTVLGVAADYYFNPRMSVGTGLSLNAGDDMSAEGNTFEIRSAIFFNPRFSVRAAFEQFFADNDNGEDEQTISFNLSTRF